MVQSWSGSMRAMRATISLVWVGPCRTHCAISSSMSAIFLSVSFAASLGSDATAYVAPEFSMILATISGVELG